jgi:5-methylcytosine-specific restriction endonuclease McrBC GTP-binding regulatory subunit McrB
MALMALGQIEKFTQQGTSIPHKNRMFDFPLQQIFYGAPGTGKSHEIKKLTKGESVIRTTFHPDSDYSTFVGCYKPTMDEMDTQVVPVVVKSGISLQDPGTYKEKRITYKFVMQAFLKAYLGAWKKWADAGDDGVAPQFLVIEEINRGNCAQIFGDLFQLLDRSDNNFSEYPIEADTDLQQEIERAFKEHKDYKLTKAINAEGAVKDYISNYDSTLSEDIQSGRILLLPPNLYIWATMNTSDQSLFPIDSAFKRRWEWKYVPIVEGYDKNTGTMLDWNIEVGNKTYKWWKFLQAINKHIGDITKSEDKKLGFFFCKATNGTISAETFVGKVLFYLWNDVYKDYDHSPAFFRDENKRLIEFSEYYEQDSSNNTIPNDKLIQAFIEKVEPSFKTPAADANPD